MTDLLELTALYAALSASPDDRITFLALADWYEDHDQPDEAECLRWLVKTARRPYQYFEANPLRYHHESWAEGWYWWTTERAAEVWGYPENCQLPFAVWDRLDHTFAYNPITFKEYATVRDAYEAVLEAWVYTPVEGRPSWRGQE
jgi:uncharacterized protein (TIGR02996 family)